MKTERISINEFLNRKETDPFKVKFQRHLDKYGIVYKIVGTTIIFFIAGVGTDYALAGGLEKGAERLYHNSVTKIGKWIIIFKGGIDTIKAIGNGDFDNAKKSFISYLLVYLVLLGLPFAFDQVDKLFADMKEG
jgi:hypothetical protein